MANFWFGTLGRNRVTCPRSPRTIRPKLGARRTLSEASNLGSRNRDGISRVVGDITLDQQPRYLFCGVEIDLAQADPQLASMRSCSDDRVREAAAAKIFAKRDAILREQQEIKGQQAKLSIRERELDRELAECRAAAKFFELADFEPPPEQTEIENIRARIAAYTARAKMFEAEGQIQEAAAWRSRAEVYERRVHTLLMAPQERDALATSAAAVAKAPGSTHQNGAPKAPRIRDVVLDLLRAAGDRGEKALTITRYIETTYSMKLHSKTVGMTLYRLSQENAVHRQGQRWFFGPREDGSSLVEPENPGADTPGPIHEPV